MALRRVLPTPAMPNTVTARLGDFTNSSADLNSMRLNPGRPFGHGVIPAKAGIQLGSADLKTGFRLSPEWPGG
jgi:hypothetical protein